MQNNSFAFNDQEERDQLSDEMISLRFLSQVDEIMTQRNISKRELANRLKTSPSYITQLFQGDKLINVRLLTRIKRVLDVKIEISCVPLPHPNSTMMLSIQNTDVEQAIESSSLILISGSSSDMLTLHVENNIMPVKHNSIVYNLIEDRDTGYYVIDSKSKR